MEWFWLFIAVGTVTVLSVIWFLGPREDVSDRNGNPVRVSRGVFWLFVLFILTPLLGIAVAFLTSITP